MKHAFALLLGFGLFASGCGGDDDGPPGGDDGGVECGATEVDCGGVCVDTDTDPDHCGVCGNACGSGERCVSGACESGGGCPSGQTECDGACFFLDRSNEHCGSCGNACASGEVCSGSMCGTTCGAPLTMCGAACTDTDTDPDNCGACDNVCPSGAAGTTPVCVAGGCSAVCDTGFSDCNADLSDGCEVDSSSDVDNCGACGNVCAVANATAACVSGACGVGSCDMGFDDCNMDAADGCEAELATDEANCGMCGNACMMDESCSTDSMGVSSCVPRTGESCADPLLLADGMNSVMWTATAQDVFATMRPSCLPGFASLTGPDVVLEYTPASSGFLTVELDKPDSTRWVMVLGDGMCGDLSSALECDSSFNGTELTIDRVPVTAGTTYYLYVSDTSSGAAPLGNPLSIRVMLEVPPCTPGMGGMVGTTTTRVASGILTPFAEFFVASDTAAAGNVWVGGPGTGGFGGSAPFLFRVPKAGGTATDVTSDASLGAAELGYDMLIDGSNVYLLNNAAGATTGHLWRITTDGGMTWNVEDYASFGMAPGDDFRGVALDGGRIHMITHEASTASRTQIWSVSATAATLPATARLDTSFAGEQNCSGLAMDGTYYYTACDTGDRTIRVDRTSGTVTVLTTRFSLSAQHNSVHVRDEDGDGLADFLYLNSFDEAARYVCDPAGMAPYADTLVTFGMDTPNYGLGYDSMANDLWLFDDDTNELVRVR